ncbi:Lysophospholipid acyltransferase, partial [Coemansia spiralis]
MQQLDQAYEWLSARYFGGVPADNVAVVAGVLLSYVLAHGFQRIPTSVPAAKHVFSIVSTAISYGIVQGHVDGVVHLAMASVAVYLLMRSLRGRAMPQAVFAVAMLHLSYSHVQRQISEAQNGRLQQDYTGAQMVFVMKVTSLANCIYDGQRADPATLSAYQRRNAVDKVPGFLEYLGYVFFFPAFAVGPTFELATYRRMVQLDSRRVEGRLTRRAYARLLEGLVWMAVYVRYSHVTFAAMVDSPSAYARRSFVSTIIGVCGAGLIARAAYYAAWKMSEGACVLAGLGFDGLDDHGAPMWTSVANID